MSSHHQVAVITPTTGRKNELERCLRSVAAQTVPCLHVIMADGSRAHESVTEIVNTLRADGILLPENHHVILLPVNTGASFAKACGHCLYAAAPWLVTTEWIAYLDEDNWFEPEHIALLLQAVEKSGSETTQWAHSLRKICSDSGKVLLHDECESLGLLHPVWDRPHQHFCDTGTLMLRRSLAQGLCPLWKDFVADRLISAKLVRDHKGATSPNHTLCYTVGPDHASGVAPDYFEQGNASMGNKTWAGGKRKTFFIFHFGRRTTKKLFERLGQHHPLDDWQMTQYDALAREHSLLDGFANEDNIPPGSHVFVSWCHREAHLPWNTLRRHDIHKHTLLVESPNIRHTAQWDDELCFMFSTVFTFWKPMLTAHLPMCKFARMNCHWLDFDNVQHKALMADNKAADGSVGLVLAHRPHLHGTFVVRNTVLQCQDPLRLFYVKDLSNATVIGRGWSQAREYLGSGVRIGPERDGRHVVDILKNFTFALVVENVDADGYVSEKFYDALLAGCIPLYLGNNNDMVGVPRDMFVDLTRFKTSKDLQAHLDTLDIPAFKRRIVEGREQVLRGASANYFADLLVTAL